MLQHRSYPSCEDDDDKICEKQKSVPHERGYVSLCINITTKKHRTRMITQGESYVVHQNLVISPQPNYDGKDSGANRRDG